jgi:hypothetical protein
MARPTFIPARFLFFVQGDGLGEEGFFLCFFLAGLKEHWHHLRCNLCKTASIFSTDLLSL